MASCGPFRPVAAFGRAAQTTLATSASIGQTALKVNSTAGFSLGAHVFTSDADDMNFQYNGPIAGLDTEKKEILATWGLAHARAAGAKLWTPIAAAAFRRGATDRIRRVRNTGARTEVTRGGQVFTTRAADAFETLEMVSNEGSPADCRNWRDFLVNHRGEGVQSFTFAFWDFQESEAAGQSRCAEARWAGPDLAFEIADGVAQLARYAIALYIVAWDRYVDE